MATVTVRLSTVGEGFIEITYDDVTLDLSLVRVHAGTLPITGRITRANGNTWREATAAAGTDQTISLPAGPIRNLSDIPGYGIL